MPLQRPPSPAPFRWRAGRLLWSVVEITLFRRSFHTWSGWRCWLLRLFGAEIGENCIIRRTVKIYYPWQLDIGNLVIIGDKVKLYSVGKITLSDRCMVSQEACLYASTNDFTLPNSPLERAPIVVGSDAWVCTRAFVGPGVTVGERAVVGACAVIAVDLPQGTVAAGDPAVVQPLREKPAEKP